MEFIEIATILRTVTGSCDFDPIECYPGDDIDEQRTNFWIDVIRVKSGDSGFGHLVDSIMEEGFHGSAVGWNNGYITEGHHRIVAAILLGLDKIPTMAYGKSGTHRARPGMYSDRFSAHDGCSVDTSVEVDL